uniref:hypothetical protein n=1 Tax=Oceanicola sp. S124 TaxID=1042378 RepID=UPI0002559037
AARALGVERALLAGEVEALCDWAQDQDFAEGEAFGHPLVIAAGVSFGALFEPLGYSWVQSVSDAGAVLALQRDGWEITLSPLTILAGNIETGETLDITEMVERLHARIEGMIAAGEVVRDAG